MQDDSTGVQGGGAAGKTGGNLSPEELYRAGTEQFRFRRYNLARASFEKYLEEKPGDPEACHILARILYLQGMDLDKAELLLRDALALNPPNQSSYLGTLAEIYISRGKYAKAQKVLEFAVSKDPKEDKRLTAGLEYHLELVRKKLKDEAGQEAEGRDDRPPIFLASQMDRWQERRKQVLFLLPSVIAHAVVLLLVGFLSTHELPFKKETKEDFTYIEVGPEAPPTPSEEAVPLGVRPAPAPMPEAPKAGRKEEAAPVPAPVTPRKEVSASGVQRQAGRATGEASLKEPGASGMRGPVGEKSQTGIPAGGEPGEIVALSKVTPDKGVDVRGAKRGGREAEPDLVRKSLGGAKATGSQAGRKEAAVRGLKERSGAQAARAGEGIFLGAGRPESGARWEKEKLVDIKARPGETEPRAAPGATEKTFALNTPNRRTSALSSGLGEPSGLAAPSLGIGVGGKMSPARSVTGGGTPGSVERSEAAATGAGVGVAPSSQAGGPGIGGAKARGSMGAAGSEQGGPSGTWGSERRAEFPGQSAGRRFASAEAVPGRRGLDIPSAGGAGAAAQRGQAQGGSGKAGRESFASLGKSEGAATGGVSGSALVSPGQASGGRGYSPGAGKAVNRGALGSGGQEGAGGEGFFERAAKKVTTALGMGGGRGTGGPEAEIRRGGRLSGLAGAGGGGGTGASGTGTGAGGSGRGTGGVRVGSAEKGSTGAGTGTGAMAAAPGQGGIGLSGTKRMAEGALGVPGGTSAEKYASAGRGNVRPGAIEKQSGVGRARYMAKASLGPVVTITTPSPGRTYQLSQVVGGMVSDTRTRQATLTVNNDSRVISVEQGSFEAVVSLSRGRNIITVTAFDMDGNVGKDTITLDYVEPSAGPPVNIVSPRDGQVFDVSEKSAVTVRGTIGDQDIKRAKLIFNGIPRDISVTRGYFEQQVALVQERNTILAEAVSRDGQVSRSQLVTVNTVNVRPKDITIILTWDKPRADMDLHIYGPQGGHTSYKTPNPYESREAIPGAQLEQDAKGNFGPEVFTQERAERGIYTVKSNYYYSGGDGNAHSTVTVILYGDNPSRRIVRVFGPHLQVDTKNGEDTWEVTKFKMPEGKFLED